MDQPDNGHEGEDETGQKDEPVGHRQVIVRAFHTLLVSPVEEIGEAHPPEDVTIL